MPAKGRNKNWAELYVAWQSLRVFPWPDGTNLDPFLLAEYFNAGKIVVINIEKYRKMVEELDLKKAANNAKILTGQKIIQPLFQMLPDHAEYVLKMIYLPLFGDFDLSTIDWNKEADFLWTIYNNCDKREKLFLRYHTLKKAKRMHGKKINLKLLDFFAMADQEPVYSDGTDVIPNTFYMDINTKKLRLRGQSDRPEIFVRTGTNIVNDRDLHDNVVPA